MFCNFVHFMRSDLDLQRIPVRTDDSRMERLVHIRFRHRNIIFKSARHRAPDRMDNTECSIAVTNVLYEYANCQQVKNLFELLRLLLHLFVNAVYMFWTAGQTVRD